MKDSIGDRMKDYYENRTRYFLPRRTHTIIRIDGKAFHTFTRGMAKPFDDELITNMDATAISLCNEIQGCKFAYIQSDEISLLLTDFDNLQTSALFDGNVQKIASVSASMATGFFNCKSPWDRIAFFDARVFTIPEREEVINYFIWRQQDATRNSIFSAAQTYYSHRQLEGKNTNDMQAMLLEKGINWNDYPVGCKRGRMVVKVEGDRSYWTVDMPPIFTQDREYLNNRIPTAN